MSSIKAMIGPQLPRILAVDPDDSKRVYLRLSGTATDQLGIYDGDTGKVALALDLQASMSAFLRRANGVLLVAGDDGSVFVSKPGGTDFTRLSGAPHLRGLGERGGKVYAATDASEDGFAVAMSPDDGASWKPLLRFDQIAGLRQCGTIASTCVMAWDALQLGFAMPTGPQPFHDAGIGKPRSGAGQLSEASDDGGGCSIRHRTASARYLVAFIGMLAIVCVVLRARRAVRRATRT